MTAETKTKTAKNEPEGRETETETRDDAARPGELDERRREKEDERGERPGARRGRGNVSGSVLKGAAVGAAAGAAVGAWAAFAKTLWPEQIEQAARALSETVGEVGRAAGGAAARTVDPAAIAELLPGSAARGEAVKRSAREAAAAAAKAAREAISTLSETENGSKSRREEGD